MVDCQLQPLACEQACHTGLVLISPTFDTAGAMARSVADCWLLDGAVTGGPVRGPAVSLRGLRIGIPQVYFWESLDPALATGLP